MLEVTAIGSHAGSQDLTFHQDGAPAHMAHVTQDLLQANCPGFIEKNQIIHNLSRFELTGLSCQKRHAGKVP